VEGALGKTFEKSERRMKDLGGECAELHSVRRLYPERLGNFERLP